MTTEEAKVAGKKIFALIDGKSVFYRGYYAMPHLTTRDGKPTGGVYGFAALALELVRRIQPDYVAVAWDKPKTNIRRRKAIYDSYKANRHPAPADFYEQIPILQGLLKDLGWPMYEMDDYEADDIMGTLSSEANKIGIHTILISSDLDMLQLIGDDTEVYAMKKGLANLEKFDVSAFEDKYGIKVSQFLDLKSLKGDNSDNIPGVPGVGEKTAESLLQEFGSLDGVYTHLDDIAKPSLKKKLTDGKDSAYMSRELARILCNAPIPLDLKAADVNNLDRNRLHQTLLDLQFTSLIKRLPDNMQPDAGNGQIVSVPTELPTIAMKPWDDAVILSDQVVVVKCGDKLALSNPGDDVAYEIGFTKASEVLADKRVITHDIKALANEMLTRNLSIKWRAGFDTKHVAFLLNSLQPTITLSEYLKAFRTEPFQATDYVVAVQQLYGQESEQLAKEEKLDNLARRVDFPLQIVLAKMEQRGVQVDTAVLGQMSTELAGDIQKLEHAIWHEVGYEFNIGSPKQLSSALFDKLQLPTTARRNKSGNYPTGAKELTKLESAHPVINLIEQYRELTKLKSTYVDALPKAVAPDGRIHTTFNQDITATGRLSSSNPNLQNIPTRSERGKEIKRAFVAPAGKVIVNADYAQFELRLAAALAHDQNMINLFADDSKDIHTMTAAEAYNIPPDQVTPDQRRHAKVINFGVLYGMSPHGLVDATNMDFATAKAFIDRYFEIRKPIREFLDKTLKQADELGYVETYFGRRRPTPDVKSSNYMVREGAKRAAANMPIQGTEADLMKMAMLKVEAEIPQAEQVMQVHDSIMVECNEAEADVVANQMKQIMENIYPKIGVRLLVETSVGHTWADL